MNIAHKQMAGTHHPKMQILQELMSKILGAKRIT